MLRPPMPTFQFTVIAGPHYDVGLSLELPDIAAARAHAEQIAGIAAARGAYPDGARIQVTLSGSTVLELQLPPAGPEPPRAAGPAVREVTG